MLHDFRHREIFVTQFKYGLRTDAAHAEINKLCTVFELYLNKQTFIFVKFGQRSLTLDLNCVQRGSQSELIHNDIYHPGDDR